MVDFLIGAQCQYVFRAVATDGTRKVCHQLITLLVDLLEHQSQLLLVLWHLVGFACSQLLTTLLQLLNLLGGNLGHLCRTACCNDFLRHIGTGILGSRTFLGFWEVGQEVFLGIAVDAQQKAVTT